jgi:uncharacterized repeat protein (TIGR03803 family)
MRHSVSKSTVFLLTLIALSLFVVRGQAQTYSVIYNLGSNSGDPTGPLGADLISQGRDGKLYTTSNGGGSGNGAAFGFTTSGAVTVLHDFDSSANIVYSGLTLGSDGNYYGSTFQGGTGGAGTVYKITPTGTETVLHNFSGGSDGGNPGSAPIQATDGNYYGTSSGQGVISSTLYKITPAGVFSTVHAFTSTEGSYIQAAPIQATDGNFYGCSNFGGTSGAGVIFKITTTGVVTVLHNFNITDGDECAFSLVQATDGKLYGTTVFGGASNAGVIFKITTAGVYTVLRNINGATDGSEPYSGLVQATDGNFYGVTHTQGTSNLGTLYKITANGGFTVIHNFAGPEGSSPESSLTQHTNGILYGDTTSGGTIGDGVLYSLNIGAAPFANLQSNSGKVGLSLGIFAQGFTGATAVSFGGVNATTLHVTNDTYMTATVPAGAKTGTVTVTRPSGPIASRLQFRVTPTITSFAPTSGPIGTVIIIAGTGLTQTTKVTIGGVEAVTFSVISDSQVSVTVPAGAKTGKIVITTAGGSTTSAGTFNVTPTLTTFSPTSGPVGTLVTINGTGLTQTTGVSFGGVSATLFTVVSDTQITATVPTGAVSGKITVTTTGGTATSTRNFIVN